MSKPLSLRSYFFVLLLGFTIIQPLQAQELSTEDLETYKEQCVDLVSFLEFTLNLVGDSETSARDKDIVINQSYLKMFRDAEVQIEDDLEESRRVVTNKDVQAYLKDIDFFFQQAQFDMSVEEVTHHLNEDGQIYFRVALSRNLQAIGINGDTINLNQPRFVEINLDPEERDLKIVSIYTTKLSEEEELSNWWNELPREWQWLFGQDVSVNDSLSMRDLLATHRNVAIGDTLRLGTIDTLVISDSETVLDMLLLSDTLEVGDSMFFDNTTPLILNHPIIFSHLRQLVELKSLDLSNQQTLFDLAPLSKLTQLKELDISGTPINSLLPLRNLTKLEVLRCANTEISDLSPLKYAFDLKELYCQQTPIRSLSPAQNFSKLEKLSCYDTNIDSLYQISALKNLKELLCFNTNISSLEALSALSQLSLLKCSNTYITSLAPIASLQNLEVLDIEGNFITDLSPLQMQKRLRLLFADSTKIKSLWPLKDLPELKKVYCDNTFVDRQHANEFMQQRPEVLVVYGSAHLNEWWASLSEDWQAVFGQYVQVSPRPKREELHQIANLENIDIFGHPSINDLSPLSLLINLRELKCSQTGVSSLEPLRDLVDLQLLDCVSTPINSLAPLRQLKGLRVLRISQTNIFELEPLAALTSLELLDIDDTPVSDLSPLRMLSKLKTVYGDGSEITTAEVLSLSEDLPELLVVYQTGTLQSWWDGLSDTWKLIFRTHIKTSEQPTREELHSMIGVSSLKIAESTNIYSLKSIEGCFRLKELRFTDTQVSSLTPLRNLRGLEILECSKNPIADLSPLAALRNLKQLICENTPVNNLEPLAALVALEDLRCGGTQIRDLKPLTNLRNLKRIDCYNTGIKSLKPIMGLTNLLRLTCYNTRLNAKKVSAFKQTHGKVEVVYY